MFFSSSFCHLFGACEQWKHPLFSVAHITSFCFSLLSQLYFESLCVSSAAVWSSAKAMQQRFLPSYLKETQKQVSEKWELKGKDDTVIVFKATTTLFALLKRSYQQLM